MNIGMRKQPYKYTMYKLGRDNKEIENINGIQLEYIPKGHYMVINRRSQDNRRMLCKDDDYLVQSPMDERIYFIVDKETIEREYKLLKERK